MQPDSSVDNLLNFWIPTEQQVDFAKTGNYVRDIDALNTRIISLNTESCDYKNLYIDSAENDPNNEIAYLIENLDELEKAGKLAIIVGHIPDECSRQYQQRFRAILERY